MCIYAWKRENIETLEEHVGTGMRKVIEDSSFRLLHLLTDEDKKWLKVSWVLHDVGKPLYQNNYKRNKMELSFIGHEFFSAFIADKLLNTWLERDIEGRLNDYKNYRYLVVGSILYHHHAMGLRERERSIGRIRTFNGSLADFKNELEGCISSLFSSSGILRGLSDYYVEVVISLVKEKDGKVIVPQNKIRNVLRYVDELSNEVWRRFVRDETFRRKFLIFVQAIVTADYISATENRGTSTSTMFGSVVKEFKEVQSANLLNAIHQN